MAADPYLRDVAILIAKGFSLRDIWKELPWEGDMPEDFIEAFALIYQRMDNEQLEKLQKSSGV
jgi:hypothetical protein